MRNTAPRMRNVGYIRLDHGTAYLAHNLPGAMRFNGVTHSPVFVCELQANY